MVSSSLWRHWPLRGESTGDRFHIPHCSIQNRNMHISVLNGALWDMEQVRSGICEIGQFRLFNTTCNDVQATPHTTHWQPCTPDCDCVIVYSCDTSVIPAPSAPCALGTGILEVKHFSPHISGSKYAVSMKHASCGAWKCDLSDTGIVIVKFISVVNILETAWEFTVDVTRAFSNNRL